MKMRYLNGARVYVEDRNGMGQWGDEHWSPYGGTIQICRHRDIIRALNNLFKHAENDPEDVVFDLWSLIHGLNIHQRDKSHTVPVKIVEENTVFDDPKNIKRATGPRLRSQNMVTAAVKETIDNNAESSDEQVNASRDSGLEAVCTSTGTEETHQQKKESEQEEKRSAALKTDTFVNLDLLYQQIDAILDSLDASISSARRWLASDTFEENAWLPAEVKKYLKWAKEDHEKAEGQLKKLQGILSEFKREGQKKPSISASPRPQVNHLQVMYGDLYTAPKPKTLTVEDDILSSDGRAFMQREGRTPKAFYPDDNDIQGR